MSDILQGKKILVIDDDINLCIMVEIVFSMVGAFVFMATDGREGLHQFYENRPDLVILDVLMPKIDGWETIHQIRLLANTPVILLTTLNADEDIVRGLDAGADDFLSKPFTNNVLLARARAILRRLENYRQKDVKTMYTDSHLSIDLDSHRVIAAGEAVKLTATEFQLLSFLLQNSGQVLTYQQILEHVWGWEYVENVDYVHVYVSTLRRKIEPNPRDPIYLETIHGIGYRFHKDMSPDSPSA